MAMNGEGGAGRAPKPRPESAPRRAPKEKPEYDYERSIQAANRGCLIAFGVFMLAVAAALLWLYLFVAAEIGGKNATVQHSVVLDVPLGSGGSNIGNMLEEEGLIEYSQIFRLYVRLRGVESEFKEGRFTVEPGMSYDEILETLSQAPPPRETIWVTIPEGSTVLQFGMRFEEAGICTAQEFVDAANDIEAFEDYNFKFMKHLEWDPNTYMKAEGYLAPNTYQFYTDETPHNLAKRLYEQFDSEVTDEMYARMESLGMSLREVVTLASLIEEEAGNPENQAGVSRVFWNRLTGDLNAKEEIPKSMGSDVTTRYLMDWVSRSYGTFTFEGKTLKESEHELMAAMPEGVFFGYYTGDTDPVGREGLPIGPISCPSQTAIEAALYPSIESDVRNALYFLTDYYGDYYYAETYAQHNRNIATMNTRNAQFEQEQAAGEDAAAGE